MNAIEININPVLWHIGGLEVRWYGVMMALGVLVLILWTMNQIRRGAKISYDTLMGAALVGIPSGIIFSRLLHVIDLWSYYSQNPGQIIGGEGLTIYGAILGGRPGRLDLQSLQQAQFQLPGGRYNPWHHTGSGARTRGLSYQRMLLWHNRP